MPTGNPSIREKTFDFSRDEVTSGTMTMTGAVNKAGILLVLLIAGAAFGWVEANPMFMMAGFAVGLISSLVVIFKRESAPIGAPIYAIAYGVAIGTISVMYEARYPGVPANAMSLTVATLAGMLALYHFKVLQATEKFKSVVILSTCAIGVTYLVDMVMGFFGHSMAMIHEASPIGIGFSLLVTGLAALNLIIDFDMFERNAGRSPKYMEWYCGFALLVTIVWLYMEMLRLLSKLNRR
jgi:uncharacterized YccA/Bax inhibitor family protein